MPQYTTFRSGLGHLPVFTGIVELAGITFTGEPAKNKKQAEKNAAMAAWSALKQCEFFLMFTICKFRAKKRIDIILFFFVQVNNATLLYMIAILYLLEHGDWHSKEYFADMFWQCSLFYSYYFPFL